MPQKYLLTILVATTFCLLGCDDDESPSCSLTISPAEINMAGKNEATVAITNSGNVTIDPIFSNGSFEDLLKNGKKFDPNDLCFDDISNDSCIQFEMIEEELGPGETGTLKVTINRDQFNDVGKYKYGMSWPMTDTVGEELDVYCKSVQWVVVDVDKVLTVPEEVEFGSYNDIRTANILGKGEGELTWEATPTESWVKVSPSSGTGETDIEITINRSLMVTTEEYWVQNSGDSTYYSAYVEVASSFGNKRIRILASVLSGSSDPTGNCNCSTVEQHCTYDYSSGVAVETCTCTPACCCW